MCSPQGTAQVPSGHDSQSQSQITSYSGGGHPGSEQIQSDGKLSLFLKYQQENFVPFLATFKIFILYKL